MGKLGFVHGIGLLLLVTSTFAQPSTFTKRFASRTHQSFGVCASEQSIFAAFSHGGQLRVSSDTFLDHQGWSTTLLAFNNSGKLKHSLTSAHFMVKTSEGSPVMEYHDKSLYLLCYGLSDTLAITLPQAAPFLVPQYECFLLKLDARTLAYQKHKILSKPPRGALFKMIKSEQGLHLLYLMEDPKDWQPYFDSTDASAALFKVMGNLQLQLEFKQGSNHLHHLSSYWKLGHIRFGEFAQFASESSLYKFKLTESAFELLEQIDIKARTTGGAAVNSTGDLLFASEQSFFDPLHVNGEHVSNTLDNKKVAHLSLNAMHKSGGFTYKVASESHSSVWGVMSAFENSFYGLTSFSDTFSLDSLSIVSPISVDHHNAYAVYVLDSSLRPTYLEKLEVAGDFHPEALYFIDKDRFITLGYSNRGILFDQEETPLDSNYLWDKHEFFFTYFNTKQLKDTSQLFIPNAFSPNNDGVNDTWSIANPYSIHLLVHVYARDGSLVFTKQGTNLSWDGSKLGSHCPTGSYFAIIYQYNQTHHPQYLQIHLIR